MSSLYNCQNEFVYTSTKKNSKLRKINFYFNKLNILIFYN